MDVAHERVGMEEEREPLQADLEESAESKASKRGGKRPGAGRKPNPAKILLKGVTREALAAAVEDIDVGAVVAGLLRSKKEIIRLQALNFVFDRMLGKPKQDVNIGGIVHHTRDPRLARLPKETLDQLAAAYDTVLSECKVLTLPAVPQDGPQNQTQSIPAIEAVDMDSEPSETVSGEVS